MAPPEIKLTHLDEPLLDGAGATKRDLADYLETVGDRFVPAPEGQSETRPGGLYRVRVKMGGS